MSGSPDTSGADRLRAVAAWTGRHQRSLLLLLVLLTAGGVFFGTRLPVALFPRIDFPRVVVSLDAGDRPAEEMAALVTYPVEAALRAIPSVRGVRSTTSRGSAEISLNFAWGIDMTAATLQAQAALAQVMPTLPAGTRTRVRRMDPTVFPVIAYSLTSPVRSGDRSLRPGHLQAAPPAVDGGRRGQRGRGWAARPRRSTWSPRRRAWSGSD